MTAEEAKKISDSWIYEYIKDYAKHGYTSARFFFFLSDSMLQTLEKNGFKVRQYRPRIKNRWGWITEYEKCALVSWE